MLLNIFATFAIVIKPFETFYQTASVDVCFLILDLRRKNSEFDDFKTVGQALLDIKFIVRLCLTCKLSAFFTHYLFYKSANKWFDIRRILSGINNKKQTFRVCFLSVILNLIQDLSRKILLQLALIDSVSSTE